MKPQILVLVFMMFIASACSVNGQPESGPAPVVQPQALVTDSGSAAKSTAADQESVEVTVYNSGLGLIKDIRRVQLAQGHGELRFMDVASAIMPVTVHIKSLNHTDQFGVLEQNYEYDLMNYDKLLDKYVGKNIKLINDRQFQDRKDVIDATLLSNNDGPIFKIDNEIYLGHDGIRVLPEIPENLVATPTLTWLYNNQTGDAHQLEVSYLTNSLSWKADYVVVLDEQDKGLDLSGWVTIDNQSGAAYKNAGLKLVAGEVNRVTPAPMAKAAYRMEMMADASGGPAFQEQAFFEYHIYDLQRKTTLKDNQTKQISLLEAPGVQGAKEYQVFGRDSYFTNRYDGGNPKLPINVYLKFKNAETNHLGMPLPAGIMRLYKKDHEGKLQFIGEDAIEHTPKDEEIKLKLGEAFDLVAERIQKDFRQVTTQLYETEWEVTLRNHKKEAVTISVLENLYGSWKVLNSSHSYVKKDANTIQFDVAVPKDGEVKVTYRISVGV